MPRLRYIEDSELTDETRGLIESAGRTGAPDPRCVKIYVRNPKVGVAWVNYWNTLLYDGLLPHRLKEGAVVWALCQIAAQRIPDSIRRAGFEGAGAEWLIEASFRFLLDREPKESILSQSRPWWASTTTTPKAPRFMNT